MGCGGGIPSIPDNPDQLLAKGDAYFKRKKNFQSQELYKAFLLRHPGNARSDHVQFMLAESYYEDKEYALAGVEYRILVSNYGYSDYVDDAYFKEALCLYYEAPRVELDQTRTREALNKLQTFVRIFPTSPLIPDVQRYIAEIREKLAEKDLKNAIFYIDARRFDAALIYLDKVIDNYPDNDYWAMALYHKATILERRLEFDQAIELYERVLDYPGNLRVKSAAREGLNRLRNY